MNLLLQSKSDCYAKRQIRFAQLVQFLDRNHFNYIVRKYGGGKYIKSFTYWNQLPTMIFGQLTDRESLRNLIVATEAHCNKLYHWGLGKSLTRSNLSKANEQRDYRIFEEFLYYTIERARQKRHSDVFKLGGNVDAFDSTTIDLCLAVFEWAKFRKDKGGIKIHTLYDVEKQIPTLLHTTSASAYDSKAMPEIPLEHGAYYIFDRGYNNFANPFRINSIGACFVIRAKEASNTGLFLGKGDCLTESFLMLSSGLPVIKARKRIPKNFVKLSFGMNKQVSFTPI